MGAFISSSPPLTMSVSKERAHSVRWWTIHTNHNTWSVESGDIRSIWWDICTIYVPLFVSIENVNHLYIEDRTKLVPKIYGTLRAMELSNMLPCLCAEFAGAAIRHPQLVYWRSLCKTVVESWRIAFPVQTPNIRTRLTHVLFFEWLWLILPIILRPCLMVSVIITHPIIYLTNVCLIYKQKKWIS